MKSERYSTANPAEHINDMPPLPRDASRQEQAGMGSNAGFKAPRGERLYQDEEQSCPLAALSADIVEFYGCQTPFQRGLDSVEKNCVNCVLHCACFRRQLGSSESPLSGPCEGVTACHVYNGESVLGDVVENACHSCGLHRGCAVALLEEENNPSKSPFRCLVACSVRARGFSTVDNIVRKGYGKCALQRDPVLQLFAESHNSLHRPCKCDIELQRPSPRSSSDTLKTARWTAPRPPTPMPPSQINMSSDSSICSSSCSDDSFEAA
ncbi:hypothetical protein IF2G_10835 [Cordyceps javanica]|nr:hypothetical protein IF2G_10835 [Cordyceps javanica]